MLSRTASAFVRYRFAFGLICLCLMGTTVGADESTATLAAHWPLVSDARAAVGTAHAESRGGVQFKTVGGRPAAVFNGRDGYFEVPKPVRFGTGDFSVATWVYPDRPFAAIPGNLLSCWDPLQRRGWNFYMQGSSSAYSSICDSRYLHFGIDHGWNGLERDHGKPWPSNSLISNLIVYEGRLYASIADASEPAAYARVFRLAEDERSWEDCGRLGNDETIPSVMSMVVHDGKMYAGTGAWDWYRAFGEDGEHRAPKSTRVYVYEGGQKWRDLGDVGKGSRVLCLSSFDGSLYAGLDSVGGGKLFRLDRDRWIDCGSPDGRNLENLMPCYGALHIATHGNVYRYAGENKFVLIGKEPHGINQIHALHVYNGRLVAGTWPQGYILRHATNGEWEIMGRLGLPPGKDEEINETNDLEYHNGALYAGLLPLAELYRYERDGHWMKIGRLGRRTDFTNERSNIASWMRLTAMASYRGRLFVGTGSCQGRAVDVDPEGTLGRVRSYVFGQMVSHEKDCPPGWIHVAAVRRGLKLELYLNGKRVAQAGDQPQEPLNVDSDSSLRIGFGNLTHFSGGISDVRLYRGALTENDVAKLAQGH
jgi:hypothetical protein